MARLACGGSAADFAVAFDTDGNAIRQPGAECTLWNALTGGTQYGAAPDPDDGTGLVDGAGTPISTVTLDSDGFVPENALFTPDGVTRLAIDASGGSGPRRWIYPNDPVAISVAADLRAQQAQATANAALSQSGGGGAGTVTKVAGQSPDGSGNVPLAAGNVGAIAAGPGNDVTLGINDQFLTMTATDEDNATSPNRIALWFQSFLVFWLNEYFELRLQCARTTTTALKIVRRSAAQTANIWQTEDENRNPLNGSRANGELFAPNIGNAKSSAQTTEPAAKKAGDIWIDMSQSPPVLKVYDGSLWIVPSGGGGGTPPDAAPAFVAMTTGADTVTSYTAVLPSGGATMLAFLCWHTTETPTAPEGWTLVEDITGTAVHAGLWIADASVTDTTWTWTVAPHITSILLGYEACSVQAHAAALDGATTATHTAPALAVGTVPATVVRLFFDKTSPGTAQTATDAAGTTRRAFKALAGTAVCTLLADDQEVDAAGTVAAVTSTYSGTAGGNGGGFTVALVAAA